jgi:Flp pilus assembly protein TadG
MKVWRSQEGSTLVELALILPVLTLMLLCVLDANMVVQGSMTVTDSTRAAAQYAALSNSTLSGVVAAAKNAAAGIPGYNVTASDSCTCGSSAGSSACSNGTCGSGTPIKYVTITATATLPILFSVKGFPASIPVRSVMRVRATGGA